MGELDALDASTVVVPVPVVVTSDPSGVVLCTKGDRCERLTLGRRTVTVGLRGEDDNADNVGCVLDLDIADDDDDDSRREGTTVDEPEEDDRDSVTVAVWVVTNGSELLGDVERAPLESSLMAVMSRCCIALGKPDAVLEPFGNPRPRPGLDAVIPCLSPATDHLRRSR